MGTHIRWRYVIVRADEGGTWRLRVFLKSRIAVILFVVWLIVVAAVTLTPLPYSMSEPHYGLNLTPVVNSIRCFSPVPGQPSTMPFCVRTLLGNVLMFVPLGLLLPLVWRRHATLAGIVGVSFAASVLIELVQFAERSIGVGRWTDVDDVLLNVLGAVIGFSLLVVGQRLTRLRLSAPIGQ
ncbi:MAG: VanZ family protein [Gemmatimonadaceae bacterium]